MRALIPTPLFNDCVVEHRDQPRSRIFNTLLGLTTRSPNTHLKMGVGVALPKISNISPFFSAAFASALPVTFPEAFSKALTLLGKLPLYSFSSFYGPLLSAYLTPAVAVVSVLSMPLTDTMTTPVFAQRSVSVAPASSTVTPASSTVTPASSTVTPAQAGAQDNRHSIEGSWHFRLQDLEATLGPRFHGGDRGMEAGMARSIATGEEVGILLNSAAGAFVPSRSLAVTPASSTVTPAQAGAQGSRQDLVSGNAMTPAICRMGPWVPASAGMTEKRAGMTEKRAGMTDKWVETMAFR